MFDLPNELNDLIEYDAATLAVVSRESKRREFKTGFVQTDLSDYTKTLAGFGNASGGYILFGISDKPRTIVGTEEVIDEARWADRIREEFDPEIPISTKTYRVEKLQVFAVGVDQVPNRPIVCRKSRSKRVQSKKGKPLDVEVIREGAIYYRYAGQTRFIGHPELMELMAERRSPSDEIFYRHHQRHTESRRATSRYPKDVGGFIEHIHDPRDGQRPFSN